MLERIRRMSVLVPVLLAALVSVPLLGIAQDGDEEVLPEKKSSLGVTTVDKYAYIPEEELPPVKEASNYKWDDSDPTVVFPINVWIGWAPIIAANGGTEPSTDSWFYKNYKFKVDLKIIDNPTEARDAFSAGESHILWGTLDMMVLFSEELQKDSRTNLRIFQQIDWSNGGDGVVARNGIKKINDLKPSGGKKKKIALAQYSPSHYYMLNLLYFAGINPDEVEFKWTQDAFQAAAAFVGDETIDACVTWAPDIYNISDPEKSGIKDAALISSTVEAKKVIADVWAARADFARDHPEIIKGLVHGVFEGMKMVKADPGKVAKMVDKAYDLPKGEAEAMMADAHLTNFAENYDFFLNQNNAANFENTWEQISTIYGRTGYVKSPPSWKEVLDPRVIEQLKDEYKDSKNEYSGSVIKIAPGKDPKGKEVLTRTVRIHFAPNSPVVDFSYHPESETIVKELGRMIAQFEDTIIVIEGHADRSKWNDAKALGDAYFKKHGERVADLSERRAGGVLNALFKQFPDLKKAKDRIVTDGRGWDKPLANDALSRRVEVKVMTPEAE